MMASESRENIHPVVIGGNLNHRENAGTLGMVP